MDGYVESLGRGFDPRQVACTAMPTKVIKKNGGICIITTPESSKDTE